MSVCGTALSGNEQAEDRVIDDRLSQAQSVNHRFSESSGPPVDLHVDELLDGHVPVAELLELADEIRRDAMDAHVQELLDGKPFVSQGLQFPDELRARSMNAHRDEALGRKALVAERAQVVEEPAADVVHGEGVELVGP